ncbi:MAG: hypothetical protein GX177_00200 [Firmicutes bacterium]|nr:hypothetical protein [Bacillota bacterium]
MLNVTYLLIKFVSTLVLSLLTLTLFDSNPFSLVLLYALITTGINFFISTRVFASDDIRTPAVFAEGISSMAIAWVMSFVIPGFRSTFLTLFALACAVILTGYFLHNLLVLETK